MRLDKFLKVSRLIKRRTVANEACDANWGRVLCAMEGHCKWEAGKSFCQAERRRYY